MGSDDDDDELAIVGCDDEELAIVGWLEQPNLAPPPLLRRRGALIGGARAASQRAAMASSGSKGPQPKMQAEPLPQRRVESEGDEKLVISEETMITAEMLKEKLAADGVEIDFTFRVLPKAQGPKPPQEPPSASVIEQHTVANVLAWTDSVLGKHDVPPHVSPLSPDSMPAEDLQHAPVTPPPGLEGLQEVKEELPDWEAAGQLAMPEGDWLENWDTAVEVKDEPAEKVMQPKPKGKSSAWAKRSRSPEYIEGVHFVWEKQSNRRKDGRARTHWQKRWTPEGDALWRAQKADGRVKVKGELKHEVKEEP